MNKEDIERLVKAVGNSTVRFISENEIKIYIGKGIWIKVIAKAGDRYRGMVEDKRKFGILDYKIENTEMINDEIRIRDNEGQVNICSGNSRLNASQEIKTKNILNKVFNKEFSDE